jgi:peroxiredoxin
MDANNEHNVDGMIAERLCAFRVEGDWQPNAGRGLAMLRQRRAAAKGRRRRRAMLAVTAATACVPILTFPMTRAFAGRCVSACVEETAVVRELLLGQTAGAPTGNAFVRPGDRMAAPDFTLNDASGRQVKLSDSRGKVVLLNFWATWCRPCSDEIPWFVEFQKSNAARGFAVLGVSMDNVGDNAGIDGGWSVVEPYIQAKGVNYAVVIGNDDVARQFGGLKSIPLTILIDRSGRIAAVHAGLSRKEEYEADINALLNEK